MDEAWQKKKFKLRLKGYWYKGVLEDWYYVRETGFHGGLPIKGTHGFTEIMLPPSLIRYREQLDGVNMLYLIDDSAFELGKQRDGEES